MNCTTSKWAIRSTALGSRTSLFLVLALLATAAVGCSKSEPTKEELLSRANEAFAAGHLVDAEKGYREVLRLQPDNGIAQAPIGHSLFRSRAVAAGLPST